MPSIRAVIIVETTQIVDNIVLVGPTPPELPNGYRYLRETEWADGQLPNIGDHWEGDLPATFTAPAPVEGGDLANMDPYELLERSKQLAQDIIVAVDLAQQKNGG